MMLMWSLLSLVEGGLSFLPWLETFHSFDDAQVPSTWRPHVLLSQQNTKPKIRERDSSRLSWLDSLVPNSLLNQVPPANASQISERTIGIWPKSTHPPKLLYKCQVHESYGRSKLYRSAYSHRFFVSLLFILLIFQEVEMPWTADGRFEKRAGFKVSRIVIPVVSPKQAATNESRTLGNKETSVLLKPLRSPALVRSSSWKTSEVCCFQRGILAVHVGGMSPLDCYLRGPYYCSVRRIFTRHRRGTSFSKLPR